MSSMQVSQMTNQELHEAADRIADRIVRGKALVSDSMIVIELSNRLIRAEGNQARRAQNNVSTNKGTAP